MEEWRYILDCPGYQVSNLGNVRSFWIKAGNGRTSYINYNKPPHLLKPGKSGRYLTVTLTKNHNCTSYLIQDLVMIAFIGPKPKNHITCHKNDCGTDNRLENLYHGTYKSNKVLYH